MGNISYPKFVLAEHILDNFLRTLVQEMRRKKIIGETVLQGPSDLGKYKISSDYWKKKKTWPLPKLLDFIKVVRSIDISNLEPKTLK